MQDSEIELLLLLFVLAWLLPSILISVWASLKGRSAIAAFLLSFFFSPLIGLIVVGFMRRDEVELNRRKGIEQPLAVPAGGDDAQFKKCPYCAELIRAEAIVCKHCGRDV